MTSLIGTHAQVRRVIPENVDTHTHARPDKVPQIALAEQNPVAVKLGKQPSTRTRYACGTVTAHRHIDPLKVGADQDRSRRRRRPGQEPLRTPQKQVVTDQEAVGALFASRPAAVFAELERTHRTEGVRPN